MWNLPGFPGNLYGDGDNTFTFEGTKDGETVVLTGNILYSAETLAEGESTSCAFSGPPASACTPCLFDIGECAEKPGTITTTSPRRGDPSLRLMKSFG